MPLMLRLTLSFVLLVLTIVAAQAQTLPRRSQLGAGVAAAEGGVTVTAIAPNSAAARAGLTSGDLIQRVGAVPVATPAEFVAAVRATHPGRATPFAIVRNGAPTTLDVTLIEAPRENAAGIETIYGAVSVGDGQQRTLLTRPRSQRGRAPALLLIGGIGCPSIDNVANPNDHYRTLAHDLTRRGIVVMRVEKSGIGDSTGPACSEVNFEREQAGYDAALTALRGHRSVDPNQVFVLGHSIGTISAPRLAATHDVAGVIALNGLGRTWIEYHLINTRRQLEMSGATPDQVDAALVLAAECAARVLLSDEPAAQVFTQRPECQDVTPLPASQAYVRQLTAVNVGQMWSAFNAPVLAIYGTSDFVSDLNDHQRIVSIVNAAHPGNAELMVLEGLDHGLLEAESQQASFEREGPGTYYARLSMTVSDWICAQARCRT
jgi:uncharacterized protein